MVKIEDNKFINSVQVYKKAFASDLPNQYVQP